MAPGLRVGRAEDELADAARARTRRRT
jgi:hypothetical protein